MSIKENTVSAAGQMVRSSVLSFFGNENAAKRILVVGNSITRHGPREEIGWTGDWGMAASAPERDYVHLLLSRLTADGYDVFLRVRQCAEWEMNFPSQDVAELYREERAFAPDLIVFRLGENVAEENKPAFREAIERFVGFVASEKTKIVFTTCFWHNEIIDDGIRAVAAAHHAPLVELGDLGDDPAMKAPGLFWHSGVAAHPGDRGMETIANRIYAVVKEIL